MARIISIIDMFDQEHDAELEFFRHHGFDIKMDFKLLRDYKIAHQYPTILNSLPIEFSLQGVKAVILRGKFHSIIKLRFKDESRKAAKVEGFRVICLCRFEGDNIILIPFHIYLHNGSRGKRDLTENEKKKCKLIIESLEE